MRKFAFLSPSGLRNQSLFRHSHDFFHHNPRPFIELNCPCHRVFAFGLSLADLGQQVSDFGRCLRCRFQTIPHFIDHQPWNIVACLFDFPSPGVVGSLRQRFGNQRSLSGNFARRENRRLGSPLGKDPFLQSRIGQRLMGLVSAVFITLTDGVITILTTPIFTGMITIPFPGV